MIRIVEREDDCYDEPRCSNVSMLCLFPPLTKIESPRKSISYNKLHQRPLKLTVFKLDGSSFGIEVSKTGTVWDVKQAVEAAFCHLPKKGPGRVSWEHVWGQFCLCHEGQKLLTDSECIRMFGIKDGDQLQFIHHASNLVRIQSEREDSDSDHKPVISNDNRGGGKNGEKYDSNRMEIVDDNRGDDVISRREYRLTHLFRGWFPYRKLTSSNMRIQERRTNSSRFSYNMLGGFKNCLRPPSSNKYVSHRQTWKGR
ncbi:hypothetical protein ABFS82_01G003700 [Erythranthe guttata]|uniref:uncharacterized protein LOC105977084 n=1 Tax=Erythranthe guttata TaxID=4155 RepID=UPI00064DE84E|nr:PREDICTED: uncharacterized protein LOC105977084 [Erythranthe guttata]|eukprot:XP_012857799.1 PREDICTED: uncharacterized protein LOC105977084 [Erythranthe guttata]